jgi:hypothetical protein
MERSENAAARHHHHGRTVGLMSEDGKREYDSESGRAAETRMSGEHTGARSLDPHGCVERLIRVQSTRRRN